MRPAPTQGSAQQENVVDFQTRAAHWAAAGRPDHAAQLYAAALDLQPADTRTRMMLADCLVRSNQHANAADHYLRVALDYASERRDRETMAICYQVLHLDPHRFVYLTVAPMLRKIGRQAYPLCARAADAHLAAGRISDGLDLLRLGTELDARNPEAHCQLAWLLLGQHRTRDAVTHLAKAGRLLLSAGNNAKYVEIAEQLLRFDAHHLETLRELPRVYLRIGEPQRAVVKLSDLMRVSPGDTVGFETLAHAFIVIGRIPTALSILRRLVDELSSNDRRAEAEAILERARGWRIEDAAFEKALLHVRQVPSARPKVVPQQPTTDDGTVVLKIADLMAIESAPPESEPENIVDLSDLVEITDAENTVVFRLQDFTQIGLAPPPPPPLAHDSTPSMDRSETTQVIDISEIEIDEDTAIRTIGHGDITALVHDEESAEFPAVPSIPCRRRSLVRTLRN